MLRSSRMAAGAGLVLYYHPYSYYSQKVVMTLHEKSISFEPVVINITKGEQYSSDYLKLNPRGEVPVLQDNGKIIPDSVRIINYLEDNFSNGSPKLMPIGIDSSERNKIEKFRNIIDKLPAGVITMGSFFHPELCENQKMPFLKPIRNVLKNAEINSANNLRLNAEQNLDAKEVLLKKVDIQEKKHILVTDKEEYLKVLKSVDYVLEEAESELASHGNPDMWLCSKEFTLADISMTILLVRLDTLGLENYFWGKGKRKCIEKYYERVQERRSFKQTVPDFYQHLMIFVKSQTPSTLGIGVIGIMSIFAFIAMKIIK